MKNESGVIRSFFVLFFRITLMLWGLFVPAVAIQLYFNGKASIVDPDFIYPAMIACFFIMLGAAVLAFLNVLEQRRKRGQDIS
jgi:hypothetical protein